MLIKNTADKLGLKNVKKTTLESNNNVQTAGGNIGGPLAKGNIFGGTIAIGGKKGLLKAMWGCCRKGAIGLWPITFGGTKVGGSISP